jgi:predicted nuclease of predicted toxin-antitoxin system
MRFKVDENLPIDAARLLVLAGHDALHVQDQQLTGAPDTDLIRACQVENRALVTLDIDFANIQQYPPRDYAGLIVMWLRYQDKKHVMDVIARLIAIVGAEHLRQHLWIVEEDRIRIRDG